MPRTCTICIHRDRTAIEKALVAGEPFRDVAKRTGTTRSSLERHKSEHMKTYLATLARHNERLRAAAEKRDLATSQAAEVVAEARALDVVGEIRRVLQRVNLLFDACDRWLRDPENPEQYDIGPRGEDINVIVWEKGPSGQVQKKRKMAYLLERLDSGGVAVERWESKHADPRELVLKTADNLKGQMEFLSKLEGRLSDGPQVNVLIAPEWLAVRAALLTALLPYPEARTAVATRLLGLDAG